MLHQIKSYWSKTNRWHRILLLFLIVELQLIPGRQLGFWCNDPSLSHRYTGDTVSWKWLMGVTILLPFAVMLIIERKLSPDNKEKATRRAVRWYKEYLFGFIINLTVVQSLKMVVGSPRPHFFDTCRPVEAGLCHDNEYISHYSCTSAHWLTQSDKSFPSGHTSLAIHAAVFIVYYLHRRYPVPPWCRVSQTLCVVSGVGCSVSRVWDRRHHVTDVAAGGLLAGVSLIYTIKYLCKNFECSSDKRKNTKDYEENKNLDVSEEINSYSTDRLQSNLPSIHNT